MISKANSNLLYIIRIVAAQCVLVGHLFSFLQLTIFKNETYFPYIQSLAVLVFFILSGFLTDSSLQRKGEMYTYKEYMIAHFKRIYLYYIPALIFIVVVDLINIKINSDLYIHYTTLDINTFIKNLFMLPYKYEPLGSGRPLWTLYIEWWLYIVYGFYYLVFRKYLDVEQLRKNKIKAIVSFVVLLVIAFVSLRNSNHITIIAFIGGILISRIYKKINIKKWLNVIMILTTSIVFIVSSSIVKNAYHPIETLLIGVMIALLLIYFNKKESFCSDKTRKLLIFISGCTYPLYLIHYTIAEFVINTDLGNKNIVKFAVVFVVSNVLSMIIYWALSLKQNKNVN